jgi:multiple sugar transport system ATP-binding protein
MADIVLQSIEKSFDGHRVLAGIDLTIRAGEFVVFVGPSGCGKSTLLRVIAGLEAPTSGIVRIGERDMTHEPPGKRGLAMVFQSYALYPHMTVRDNIGFPLKMAAEDPKVAARKVEEVARTLNLESYLERRPRELSGGQRQRVAIGRALVRNPAAFLFDEPLSNLDAALRVSMRAEIAALHRELGTTMVYVTHDQTEAMTLADRIVVLNRGRIEQVDTPLAIYRAPATRFVAGFIGSPSMNFVEGGVASRFGAAALGIRPEDISITQPGEGFAADVEFVERLAVETFVRARSTDLGTVTVRVPGDSGLRVGDGVGLVFDERKLHRFDSDERAVRTVAGADQ